jgi:hypothetical protein
VQNCLLVVFGAVRDLLFCAKHLLVAAILADRQRATFVAARLAKRVRNDAGKGSAAGSYPRPPPGMAFAAAGKAVERLSGPAACHLAAGWANAARGRLIGCQLDMRAETPLSA